MSVSGTFATYEKKEQVKNSIGRLMLAVIAIAAEVLLITTLIFTLNEKYTILAALSRILALVVVIGISTKSTSASVKLPWVVMILLNPIIGVTVYLMVGLGGSTRRMRARFLKVDNELFPLLHDDEQIIDEIAESDLGIANIFRYVSNNAFFPVYNDSNIEFYSEARVALDAQKEAMRKAEHFIFLEYHAIEDSAAFAGVKEILAERASEGVEVRVIYDDVGSIGFIDSSFIKRLEALGIRCRVFNPVVPIANVFLNNRDHRKICIVDGKVGFTGGYNLANEYFNLTRPYGDWKDSGVKLEGNAVHNLTMMFLEIWNATKTQGLKDASYECYMPDIKLDRNEPGCCIQPYGDTPLDHEHVGENVYLSIINNADGYVWFTTPYLIISDEMNRALTLAAARGVDVRIVTPGIPDKRAAYAVTRSHYMRLARDGVKIYEYVPGFCHAKQCVADDEIATCGTINLDYRSLYHHFENGVVMYNCRAVRDIKQDFETVFGKCLNVTDRYMEGKISINIFRQVLRLFSVLM